MVCYETDLFAFKNFLCLCLIWILRKVITFVRTDHLQFTSLSLLNLDSMRIMATLVESNLLTCGKRLG